MSSINWSEVLAIFVGFGAFFIYLMARLDNFKKEINDKIDLTSKTLNDKIDMASKTLNDKIDLTSKTLNDKIESNIKSLSDKIEGLQKDINRIDSKVSNIEGQITQMTRPNIIPIKKYRDEDNEPKEN